jgi:hypothetical protein
MSNAATCIHLYPTQVLNDAYKGDIPMPCKKMIIVV